MGGGLEAPRETHGVLRGRRLVVRLHFTQAMPKARALRHHFTQPDRPSGGARVLRSMYHFTLAEAAVHALRRHFNAGPMRRCARVTASLYGGARGRCLGVGSLRAATRR